MVFFHIVSNFTGLCNLMSFGNRSWIGTPFGRSSDCFVPFGNEKQTKDKEKNPISFEFSDKFKAI